MFLNIIFSYNEWSTFNLDRYSLLDILSLFIVIPLVPTTIGIISEFILPVVDNLEKAVDAKTEDENYKQGVELVLKQLKDVLALNGVKEIETIGKTFDPELHEAVASVTDENLGEKEITEEYRKGYILGSKVIRHSMVVVAN